MATLPPRRDWGRHLSPEPSRAPLHFHDDPHCCHGRRHQVNRASLLGACALTLPSPFHLIKGCARFISFCSSASLPPSVQPKPRLANFKTPSTPARTHG